MFLVPYGRPCCHSQAPSLPVPGSAADLSQHGNFHVIAAKEGGLCVVFFFFLSIQCMKPSQVSNWRSMFKTSTNQLPSMVIPLCCWHPFLRLLFFQCQGAKGTRVPFAKSILSTGMDSHQGLPSSSSGETADPCRIAALSISGPNT